MSGSLPPQVSTALLGVPTATLQLWLTAAQSALHALQIGGQPQTVSYAQGDGQKLVTYTKTNMAQLRLYVGELQAALGNSCGRRAISVGFSTRGDLPWSGC